MKNDIIEAQTETKDLGGPDFRERNQLNAHHPLTRNHVANQRSRTLKDKLRKQGHIKRFGEEAAAKSTRYSYTVG
jgi:hypothetical protein